MRLYCLLFRFWYFTVLFWLTMEEMMCIGETDDTKVIEIKLGLCSKTCNDPKIPIKPEAMDATITNSTTDTITQSGDQPQNAFDRVQIKHEIDSDSDIEVDLAYSIIDTFNVCEVKSFKREGASSLPETSPKVKLQNDHRKTQFKVEVDNKTAITEDLYCEEDNHWNAGDKEKNVFVTEDVDYVNIEDVVNKTPVYQLQNKGMW